LKVKFPPESRLLAALSGLLLILACPPLNIYILAWTGLVPFFLALERTRGSGFHEGLTAGTIFSLGVIYWLTFNTGTYLAVAFTTMLAATVILAVSWGSASWMFLKIRRRFGFRAWMLVPFSWIAWEGWLSHLGELAFPWPLLALTQARFPALLQIMEFTGIYGVSFWIASLNVVVFMLLMTRDVSLRRASFICLAFLIVIPPLAWLNAERYNSEELDTARIMAVQGSVPAHLKWTKGVEYSWAIYDSLTRAGAETGADLVVWPETALPTHLLHESGYVNRLASLSNNIDSWILTGASDFNRMGETNKPLNGAFLTGPDRSITNRTAKIFLVPFGERVPFQWIIPQLGKLNFGQAEFLPGLRQTLFEIPGSESVIRFPVMICYESIFPQISRQAVKRGANLLVTISNDAWYGRSSQPSQIAALSRFRCIETRRAMARVSNAGISALIDHRGRELVKTRLYQPTYITAQLPLCEKTTFYVAYGDVFLMVVTFVFGVILLYASFGKSVEE